MVAMEHPPCHHRAGGDGPVLRPDTHRLRVCAGLAPRGFLVAPLDATLGPMVTSAPTPRGPLPVGPTLAEWAALSPAERERFLVRVNDALSDPRDAMTEGRPHKKAKTRAIDLLGLHFKAMGRVVYLAEEMAVVYPGEEVFGPDVLAVVDVPQPEDDERMAWVVVDEGKGLDFVLEVLHRGDRAKDLVDNVTRYARLGIPEYFVYDRGRQQIHAHRLGDGARYERIVPQSGRYTSDVLGLDLAIQGGTLRFFQGMAELFGSADLIGRLTGMLADLEAKAEHAEAKAEHAVEALRAGLLAILGAHGASCPEDERRRIAACKDVATLQRWLVRAANREAPVLD